MELEKIDEKVLFRGSGLDLIRLKTDLSERLGSSNVTSEGRAAFSVPIRCLPFVLDLLPSAAQKSPVGQEIHEIVLAHESARAEVSRILSEQDLSNISPPWDGVLDPAQAVAVRAMTITGLRGLCLFDEQGIGKTIMAIAAFDILRDRDEVDALIVICPKSMIDQWPQDLRRFTEDKYRIIVAEGDSASRQKAARADFDVFVTNFEGLDTVRVTLAALSSRRRFLLIVDESYYVKNEAAKRSSMVRWLRQYCAKAFVLCGTPAPNSPLDLIHQFDIADGGYTFGGFAASGDTDKDRSYIEQAIDERGIYIRRLKEEVLPILPEKKFQIVRVSLTGKQAELYEQARSQLELDLRGLDNSSFKRMLVSYFQRRATLLQICACPAAVDPLFAEEPAKYGALDQLLDRLIREEGKKVVLWSFYRKSLEELMSRYNRFAPVKIDGESSSAYRKKAVDRFQNDPNTRLFIGNPAAAGAGLTLHAAAHAVYISFSNQAAHYLQSLDRIHRRGQLESSVNYHLLVCDETIEETELERLRSKELAQHSLLGDAIKWPSSIDEALAELQRKSRSD